LKGDFKLNNQWVVPHNLYLSTKFNAHINVEICNTIGAVKYLYKYVYKGSDKATFSIQLPEKASTETTEEEAKKANDEILKFQDARYVSGAEACWRIYDFPLFSQSPKTYRLPVHIQDEQSIVFKGNLSKEQLAELIKNKKETELTHFFQLNVTNEDVRSLHYHELPKYYTWLEDKRTWNKRKNVKLDVVGRMYFVHPTDTERYYLRTLLLYRIGCDSFASLRTVNNIEYETFKEACIVLGYAKDDNEWHACLKEASFTQSAQKLRDLFVLILLNCSPANPGDLWEKFKNNMSEDFLYSFKVAYNNDQFEFNDIIYNLALNQINDQLLKSGSNITKFSNMPDLTDRFNINDIFQQSNLILEELQYDENSLKQTLEQDLTRLNFQQKIAFDTITKRVYSNEKYNNVFFIDGPGGTGKTFVYKTILAFVRKHKDIALAVASSGIASLLLPGARTGHSRFKIPFELNASSTCNIKKNSDLAKLIQRSKLILWDECPMMHRFAFEALNETLKDIMGEIDSANRQLPFGGIVIVFGGDFRQILPVVKRGTRGDIVRASFNKSKLWENINVLKLEINMRIQSLDPEDQNTAKEFGDWLIRVGEGKEETFLDEATGFKDFIKLPDSIASQMTQRDLVNFTFPQLHTE
jgi:hypothetical protein